MATFKLMFAIWAVVLTLVCIAGSARAQESTTVEAHCTGWACFDSEDDNLAGKWTEAEFFEVGLRFDRQYSLFSYPNDLDKVRGHNNQIAMAYGWGTHKGGGISAFTLRLGSYVAEGERDGNKVTNDEGTFGLPGTFTPGFLVGQYLSRRFILTEGFSLPLSGNGPGFQFDLGASVCFSILGQDFAVEAGINAGIYRTGLMTADDHQVNMLGLGPSLNLIYQPWGRTKVVRE